MNSCTECARREVRRKPKVNVIRRIADYATFPSNIECTLSRPSFHVNRVVVVYCTRTYHVRNSSEEVLRATLSWVSSSRIVRT